MNRVAPALAGGLAALNTFNQLYNTGQNIRNMVYGPKRRRSSRGRSASAGRTVRRVHFQVPNAGRARSRSSGRRLKSRPRYKKQFSRRSRSSRKGRSRPKSSDEAVGTQQWLPGTSVKVDSVSINRLVDNYQGSCDWFGFNFMTADEVDYMLPLIFQGMGYTANTFPIDLPCVFKPSTKVITIKSQLNHNQEVSLYRCVPKKEFNGAFGYIDGHNPTVLFTGFKQEAYNTTGGGGAISPNHAIWEPSMSPELVAGFKVKMLWRKCLIPGEEKVVTLRSKYFRFQKKNFGVESGVPFAADHMIIKKCFNAFYLLKVRGCVVHQSTAEEKQLHNAPQYQSRGSYSIGVLMENTINYLRPKDVTAPLDPADPHVLHLRNYIKYTIASEAEVTAVAPADNIVDS